MQRSGPEAKWRGTRSASPVGTQEDRWDEAADLLLDVVANQSLEAASGAEAARDSAEKCPPMHYWITSSARPSSDGTVWGVGLDQLRPPASAIARHRPASPLNRLRIA